MSKMLPILSALLIIMAWLAALRARSLLRRFNLNLPSEEFANRLKRSELLWRLLTHIFSFSCLSPVPWMLTGEILHLTALKKLIAGGAATAGLISLGLKYLIHFKITMKKLFEKDVTLLNQIELATLGFLFSLAIAIIYMVWADPDLLQAVVKKLGS